MSMKLGIVAEFTDRASKRMRRFLKFNEKMEKLNKSQAKFQKASAAAQGKGTKSTAKAAQQSEKLARAQGKIEQTANRAFRAISVGAKKAGRSIQKLHNKNLALAKSSLKQIGAGAGKVGKGAMLAGGIMASMWAGSALAAGSMVDVASQFEKFETILISSTGSSEKAKEAMAWVQNFAVTTPYELDQVTAAFVQLKNYGIDPTDGTLRTLGDTSAAMGKDIGDAVEALADAVTGENERLKSFGITAAKTGKLITYSYTNSAGEAMKATVKAGDRAAIQMKLMGILNEKYAGSMERLSGTWEGMIANVADMWVKFQLMIMDAGLFDWMKDKLKLVLDTINQMEADGSLKVWATEIAAAIQTSLESAWEFATRAIEIIGKLSGYLGAAAEFVGGWENLAMVLAAFTFGPSLISTAVGIGQIVGGLLAFGKAIAVIGSSGALLKAGAGIAVVAKGLKALSLALLGNPVILAVLAIAGAVYLIYRNWDKVKPYFEAIWNGIKSAFDTAWNWIKSAFKWDPVAAITGVWSSISKALSDPLDLGKKALDAAWKGIKALFNLHPITLVAKNWTGISEALSGPIDGAKAGVKTAFNAVVKFVEEGWAKLQPIFDTITNTAKQLGETIGGTITAAVDGAKSALAALQGAKGADRFMDQLNQIAGHGIDGKIWGTRDGFQKGQALTEGLAAGTVSMQTYREELQKVSVAGGKYANVAAKMLDASTQLDAFTAPDQQAAPQIETATQQAELDKLRQSAEGLPPVINTAISDIDVALAGIDFTSHGESMMKTIANGMRNKAHLLTSEMRKVTQGLRDHLPSSPAKVGPLSDIHRLKFSETIAQSIKPGPMVKAMRRAASATLAAASISAPAMATTPSLVTPPEAVMSRPSGQTSSGGSTGGGSKIEVNFAPVITVGAGSTASGEDISEQIAALIPELVEAIKRQMKDDERLEF